MFWNWLKDIRNWLNYRMEVMEKNHRQRNYKLIYSDTYGYGVEEVLSSTVVYQWFLNHEDYIDYDDNEYGFL